KIGTPKCCTQSQLVAPTEHHRVALTDAFQVFIFRRILAIANVHKADICTGNFAKSIQVIFPYFIGDDRCSSNDLDSHRWSPGFLYNAAKNTELKKIEIVARYLTPF